VYLVIAIAVGVVGGLIGAVPFVVARARIKERLKKDGAASIATAMVATLISFLIMAIELTFCFLFAREYLLPFAISAIVVFMLAMGVYTVKLMRQ
jgi:hypothetical protein